MASLFDKLKSFYSGGITIRNIKNDTVKILDVYNTQSLGNLSTNYLQSQLNGIYRSAHINYSGKTGWGGSNETDQILKLYRDYEIMDQDPIISSAISILSEESTTRNEFGDVLYIYASDEKVKSLLENFFYDILNIEYNLFYWIRNLVKYGNWYMKLDIAEELGIVGVNPISVYDIIREETYGVESKEQVKFKVTDNSEFAGEYDSYEISHMRLLDDAVYLPYGKSMIEGARKIWKQLSIMEDAMLIHRIMRAPQKRVFKIDVGNIAPDQVELFVQNFINKIKKVPYVDQNTGEYNLYYNIENLTEDFYIPVRGQESGTEIDTLSGLEYSSIDDIEYLRNKMMAALRIPKAFLGYEEGIGSKSTLASEDVRFARTIERIQRQVEHELINLAVIHLFMQGIPLNKLMDIEISLTHPSTIYEQEKIEIWNVKNSLAREIKETKYLSSDWIYENIFGLTEKEVEIERGRILEDIKRNYRYAQIEEEGNDPKDTKQHVSSDGDVRGLNDPDDIKYDDTSNINQTPDDKEETEKKSEKKREPEIDDPLGKKDRKNDSLDKTTGRKFKGGSPLSRENLNNLDNFLKKTKKISIKKLLD